MDKVIVIDMGTASIDPILAASDVAVELNPAHRSSCYSGYADTGLTSEVLSLVIDFNEVKNVFRNHDVRLGCSKFIRSHSGRA